MNTAHRLLPIAALLAGAIAASTAHAETLTAAAPKDAASCSTASLTPLQQRLVAKADEGVGPLVHFIYRTRMIYQLNPNQVANQLEGWRAQGQCATASSQADRSGS